MEETVSYDFDADTGKKSEVTMLSDDRHTLSRFDYRVHQSHASNVAQSSHQSIYTSSTTEATIDSSIFQQRSVDSESTTRRDNAQNIDNNRLSGESGRINSNFTNNEKDSVVRPTHWHKRLKRSTPVIRPGSQIESNDVKDKSSSTTRLSTKEFYSSVVGNRNSSSSPISSESKRNKIKRTSEKLENFLYLPEHSSAKKDMKKSSYSRKGSIGQVHDNSSQLSLKCNDDKGTPFEHLNSGLFISRLNRKRRAIKEFEVALGNIMPSKLSTDFQDPRRRCKGYVDLLLLKEEKYWDDNSFPLFLATITHNSTPTSDSREDIANNNHSTYTSSSKVYVLFHDSNVEISTVGCKVRLYEPSLTTLKFAGICQKNEEDEGSLMVDKVLLCAFMYEVLNEDR